ncbi:NAD-P-binding protein [Cubamyces sp. BRFM 1775]|nr:NAD-P-binding protein [Cubamyces sp. BRFM 1775]
MSAKLTVAIVGGTGLLGHHISNVFLKEFNHTFGEVRVLARDPSSAKAQDLANAGAVLYKFDEANVHKALDEAFAGVDVIVDTLSTGFIPEEISNATVEAGARSPAKVYILSEWGLEHEKLDVEGVKLAFWIAKQKLAARARELLRGKKIIRVYTSAFLELLFRPGSGPNQYFLCADWWKVPSDVYEFTGSSSQRVTFTSMDDIGRSAARLALLAVDPATASQVPDELRIAGTTASVEEIRDIVVRHTGKQGTIKCNDLAEARRQTVAGAGADMALYVRVAAGEGWMDYSKENANELINPGQSLWKWKTVDDELKEMASLNLIQ